MSVLINGTDGIDFNDGSNQSTAATPYGRKNLIINGDMRIAQRGTSETGITSSGYYQVSGQIEFSSSILRVSNAIYKNGSQFKQGTMPTNFQSAGSPMASVVSALVYMNGTTDYIELYAWQNGGSTETLIANSGFTSYFQAFLARAA